MSLDKTFTEKELKDLLHNKNRDALDYLYHKYSPALYGCILRSVKDEKLAGQILTEGFIKMWRECSSIRCIKQTLFVWMHSIICKEIKLANEKRL